MSSAWYNGDWLALGTSMAYKVSSNWTVPLPTIIQWKMLPTSGFVLDGNGASGFMLPNWMGED